MMKVVVCTRYGSPDVLQIKEVEKPIPGENEVLIRIYAASVTAADTMMRKGKPLAGRFFMGRWKPRDIIIGTGFAGEIEAVGSGVSRFCVGDSVLGASISGGTNAEYICVADDGLIARMPEDMTYEEAAPVCDGALTSLNFLKNIAAIQSGQNVLVNGASGSVGCAALQLASHFGARVTGVCSIRNMTQVQAMGANVILNYGYEDFTQMASQYDIVFDTVGTRSFSQCKQSLTERGIYLSPVFRLTHLVQVLWTSVSRKKAKFSATRIRPVSDLSVLLDELLELFVAGKVTTVIDRVYPLTEIVEAHRYVDTKRKCGNVVLSLA